MGVELINDAEITSASDVDGGPVATDADSVPGDDATPDDLANDNDTADTTGGDDQDPAVIDVGQVFDLALRKTLSTGQSQSVFTGDTVSFDITVFNQGSIDATRVDLVDYVPTGLQIIQENGWGAPSAQNVSRRNDIIPSGLAPGQSTTVQARFLVTAQQPVEIENAAEIIRADNVLDIEDCDSTEDGNSSNDGNVMNDDIGTECDTDNGDEDDHDIEPITIEVFDLALIKGIDSNATPGPFMPGSTVRFVITVINQGTIDAFDIDVVDRAPTGLSVPTLVPGQPGVTQVSPGNFSVCLLYTSPSPRDRG